MSARDHFAHPVDRWEPWQQPECVLAAGPDRIRDEPPPAGWTPPLPVGFAAEVSLRRTDEPAEPLLWEGDQA